MKTIDARFGPFSQDRIEFYFNGVQSDTGSVMNNFQKQLIYNLFYRYFGDTSSIKAIDGSYDYIRLMLAAKNILTNCHMVIMPYVISAKVEKLVTRKTINKKEEVKLKASPYYPMVMEKYRSEKIMQSILSSIATVISSNFRIVDYDNPDINGKYIDTIPDMVMEEMLCMSLLY
jgi:hypothetical protein